MPILNPILKAKEGRLCRFLLFVFAVALGDARASDPPVPCGHRPSCGFGFSTVTFEGMVSFFAINSPPNVFWSVRCSHSCEYDGSDRIVKTGAVTSTVALVQYYSWYTLSYKLFSMPCPKSIFVRVVGCGVV